MYRLFCTGRLGTAISLTPLSLRRSSPLLATNISTPQLRRGRMFHRAVQEDQRFRPQNSQNLLNSSSSRLNISSSTTNPSSPAGTKRKFNAPEPPQGKTRLASLHETVYFDENDFDDDDSLDFGGALDVSEPAKKVTTDTPPASATGTHGSPSLPEQKPPVVVDDAAPTSSAQLPWSSSPPSHFIPPPRRTIPWLQQDNPSQNNKTPDNRPNPRTARNQEPKPKKGSENTQRRKNDSHKRVKTEPKNDGYPALDKVLYPWDKSVDAYKAEQKELRKQNGARLSLEKKSSGKPAHEPPAKVPSIFLSDEQKHVIDVIVGKGASVFFTGSAGTGKSVLMREIIRQMRTKYKKEPDRIAVTASTGLAACNIEGVTLHSFAGVGLGKESATELVKKVKRNQKARTRWLRTKVLVIDEVSMVDGDFFDKLEELARKVRNNGRPFGGIQLVVTGDFFQLPPVPEGSNREAKFSFSAATWNTSIQHTILLTHVFRQKDPEFAAMLNEMRLGRLQPSSIEAFRKLSRPLNFHDSLEATELFPTRAEVENANAARMDRLSGELMAFNATDSGTIQDVQTRERLLANCMAPPTIHLKKGSQVMLIKNMDETLVNGSLGKVIAFMDPGTFDYYKRHEDEFQGDGGDEDPAAAMRKMIKPMSLDPKNGGITTSKLWPMVSFVQPDGTERHLLCQPETWKIELPNGEVQAQRQQVPLILAWALSIHKAQGQTLQRVKVDLGRVFEKGQAYVALSRATSQAGLQVSRFDPRKVMVHNKVTEFYSNLSSIKEVKQNSERKPASTDVRDEQYLDSDDEVEAFAQMHA